jgi:hypothetical protein
MNMQRIVGGIQVEDDLLRRVLVRFQKKIDKQRLNLGAVPSDPAIASRLNAAQLEPVERAFPGQRRTILGAVMIWPTTPGRPEILSELCGSECSAEQHRFAEAIIGRLGKGAGAWNCAAAVVEPVADDMPARNVAHPGSPIGCDGKDHSRFWRRCPGVAIDLLQNRARTMSASTSHDGVASVIDRPP